ncbi:unnamed protein product [Cercospora beticola]|nr:unnamed protein product [Cercospora beticola]
MTPGGSKFFTWTKGDRKHVSSGMVQIPVECIEIKGMGYGRNIRGSRKRGRKPLPLSFCDTKSDYSAQSHDSFTLHEAAVQSATSLIAAMSEMLKSPHFNGGPRSCELRPPQGRLRSHTAPPTPATPLVEAPCPEPVELPATDSIWPSRGRGASIMAETSLATNERHRTQAGRPQSSSPQGSTEPPGYENTQNSDNDQGSNVLRPSLDSTLCGKSDECFGTPNRSQESLEYSDTSVKIGTPNWKLPRTPRRDDKKESPTGSAERIPGLQSQCDAYLVPESPGQSIRDISKVSGMLTQVANMRSAHEAHIATLKAAHDQEITSFRAYVVLLEQQHSLIRLSDPRQSLSIDTARHCGRAISGSTASRTGSLQSLDSLSMDLAGTSPEPVAEAEALKRKLDLANKTNADLGELRRERDRLKDSDCQKERRITQLKDIIRKTKENEQAQRTAVMSLQADLAAANMQRVDVLTGLDDAYKDLRLSYQREARLRERCEELQSHLRATGCVTSALPIQPMQQSAEELVRCRELKADTTKRNSAVPQVCTSELEQQISTTQLDGDFICGREACQQTHDRLEIAMTDVQNLQARLLTCQEHLKAAQADRERYNSLLHIELRRQSKIAGPKEQVATPELQREISKSLATRLQGTSASPSSTELQSTLNLSAKDQAWEQELRHCVEEIIMYKLDVSGYKKDLKLATAKIESLEAELRATTAEARSHEKTRDNRADMPLKDDSRFPIEQQPGLGIAWTQQRSASTPSALSNSHAESPPQPSEPQPERESGLTCISPRRQTTTPLSIHKQLPLPPPLERKGPTKQSSPPSTSTPQNHVQIQRAETLRSLSDSIISSYTKRDEFPLPVGVQRSSKTTSTPRPPRISRGSGGRPLPSGIDSRERLSRGNSAVLMPISRFSSGMLKAPSAVEITAGRG